MSLKCAIQLGIPDIIHNHGQPITLLELVSKLHIHPKKSSCLHRLMGLLVHSSFFTKTKVHENQEDDEEAYILPPSSRLTIKDKVTNLSPFIQAMLDPVLVSKDGYGTVWVGFRPALPRPDPFRDLPQKNPFTAPPRLFQRVPV